MRITYDAEVDILLITLSDADAAAGEEVAPGVVVDYDAQRNPISIEIQHASERYPESNLVCCNVAHPVSLSELANEYGLPEAHLRRLATTGRLVARKIGRRWTATRAALEEYMERLTDQAAAVLHKAS